MIINETYTIRIISSDNPANFITTVTIDDTTLCDVAHDGYAITITTKDLLGETVLTVRDFEGKGYEVPVIVDSIDYTYEIHYDGTSVNNENPALIYYNTTDSVEQFEIVEKKFSTLYNRYLTASEGTSGTYNVSFQYPQETDGIILSSNINLIQVNMLSAFSETHTLVSFQAADGTNYSIELPIYVIDGDRLGIFPSGNIVLDERNTTTKDLIVTGTDSPLTITGSPVGFTYTVIDDRIIRLLPHGANAGGTRLDINSFFNGNTKTTYKEIYVRAFPLSVSTQLKIAEVGKTHSFLVEQVIGDLTLEGQGDTVGKFGYSVEYNRATYSAQVTIVPTIQMVKVGTINIIDSVVGRIPRVVTSNIKFVKDLDLTVVVDNVKALDIPLKVRFVNAEGALKFMAVSRLTGYSIRTEFEYDINPYTHEVSKSDGYLYVYPIAEDTIVLRVADSRSFEDVELHSEGSGIDFSKWVAIIPTAINQQDLSNNLTSPAVYSDERLKAGDYVGNTWIEGYKYGTNQVTQITYKVSPPNSIKDNAEESLTWMRNLVGTTHTLNISVRDGFILEDINKNWTVQATWLSDNIFETADITEEAIYLTDAQTVLIADTTDRISVTNSVKNTGVIIYNEEGEENVTSRIDFEPVSFIKMKTLIAAKKIPMNKPSNCYDIKRMDSTVESGEFKIFPSTKTDDNIDVLCEFGKDVNGVDEVWTVIPEKSMRNFAEIVGKVVGEGNIELDVVSNGGIHPEFYPSALDSNNSLSYLFLELPYAIKSFGYTLDTREVDENAAGTFKILTDTSDIYHVNGLANSNTMLTRQGSVITYNSDLISENLGQVTSLPVGLEDYEHIENANGGVITPTIPSDRLIIMNSGSAEGYTLAETFVKELRFKSIYNAENITTDYWMDNSSSGIDLVDLVTLSSGVNWIISDKETVTYELSETVGLKADTTWLISNTESKVMELDEYINIAPKEVVYNVSDSQDTLIDLSEFVNLTPKDPVVYNISNIENQIVEALSEYDIKRDDFGWNISFLTEIIGQMETNNTSAPLNIREIVATLYHDYNISFVQGYITEMQTNNVLANLNIREIVATDYHQMNISFIEGKVTELSLGSDVALSVIREDVETDYHEMNISEIDSDLIDLTEYVRMSVYEHDKVVSIVIADESVSEIPTSVAMTYDIKEIVSDLDAYAYNIAEFVTLTVVPTHDLIITNVDSKIINVVTRTHFDSYHPVNRLWRDSTPMDITKNDIVDYLSQDRSDIINPDSYPLIDISTNVNNNLSVDGHNPELPYTIFQDARKADVYDDSTSIDMRNIEYIGTETDVITQHNTTDTTAIHFFNTEFVAIENDVGTQSNYDTTSLVDMRNLVYTGSETDISNQYFDLTMGNTVTANAEEFVAHLLPNETQTILQKTYKNLDLVSVSRENWTQQDIFNKWPRINGAEYFANESVATGEADDWYMSGETIIMPTNTAGLNAFISPYKYENYTLESRLYSSNGDDDTIGLVAAHTRIGSDNYTLYVSRTKAGQNPISGLGFIFSKNNGQQVITNISVGGTSGGWSGNWSKMKVVREGDIFKVWASEWNNSNYSTTEPVMTIDLNDYPEMEMLQGAKSYGYMTWSQADTRYYDNSFVGGSGAGTLVEIKDINGEWVEFIEGIDYPTHADYVDIRSTEEIEFNMTFKEEMIATAIDMRNLEYNGTENDIIEQHNETDLTPINIINMLYTGTETDIISEKVGTAEFTTANLVNMDFDGEPNANIATQYSARASEFDANPTKLISVEMRVNIVSQKKISIMDIGEQVHTLRDNTYISTQKLVPRVGEIGDTLRLHLPTVYKKDTVVEADLIEFTSTNTEATIISIFTENNIRETEVLDFNITGTVDEATINTYEGSNIEAVETVSIV